MNIRFLRWAAAAVVAALVFGVEGSARAAVLLDTLGFNNITANNVGDATIGETQLGVEVWTVDGNVNQVAFRFVNVGPAASSITDVYFDDGTLLAIAQIIDADDGTGGDPNVDFSQGASPSNLPGGETMSPAFEATAIFNADSDPPVQFNGVNPGESLTIIFDLQSSFTPDDVMAQLETGQLRIGVHVQGYDSGGSESFVANPPSVPPPPGLNVPEPATWLVMGLGAVALFGLSRRRPRGGAATGP